MNIREEAATPANIFGTFDSFLVTKPLFRDEFGNEYHDHELEGDELDQANEILKAHGVEPADELAITWEDELSTTDEEGFLLPGSRRVDVQAVNGDLTVLYSFHRKENGTVVTNRHFIIDQDESWLDEYYASQRYGGSTSDTSAIELEQMVGMKFIGRDEYFALASLARFLATTS